LEQGLYAGRGVLARGELRSMRYDFFSWSSVASMQDCGIYFRCVYF
jgi:hypothetical protein